jgi:hypothetical protein
MNHHSWLIAHSSSPLIMVRVCENCGLEQSFRLYSSKTKSPGGKGIVTWALPNGKLIINRGKTPMICRIPLMVWCRGCGIEYEDMNERAPYCCGACGRPLGIIDHGNRTLK